MSQIFGPSKWIWLEGNEIMGLRSTFKVPSTFTALHDYNYQAISYSQIASKKFLNYLNDNFTISKAGTSAIRIPTLYWLPSVKKEVIKGGKDEDEHRKDHWATNHWPRYLWELNMVSPEFILAEDKPIAASLATIMCSIWCDRQIF